MKATNLTIRVGVVRANAEPGLVSEFGEGLQATYGKYGVEALASPLPDDDRLECTLVLARTESRVVGGLRLLRRRNRAAQLPFERVLSDRGIGFVHAMTENDGEFGATWVAEDLRKSETSELLVRVALAASTMVGVTRGYGIGHQFVVPFYGRFGFTTIQEIEPFAYPDPRYRTQVLSQENLDRLTCLRAPEQKKVLTYRRTLNRNGQYAQLLRLPGNDIAAKETAR